MFVQGDRKLMDGQRPRHGKRPGGVHVGGDDGDAVILAPRVKKNEIARNIDLRARGQRRTFRADENILEIEFQILFDAHTSPFSAACQQSKPGQPASYLTPPRRSPWHGRPKKSMPFPLRTTEFFFTMNSTPPSGTTQVPLVLVSVNAMRSGFFQPDSDSGRYVPPSRPGRSRDPDQS